MHETTESIQVGKKNYLSSKWFSSSKWLSKLMRCRKQPAAFTKTEKYDLGSKRYFFFRFIHIEYIEVRWHLRKEFSVSAYIYHDILFIYLLLELFVDYCTFIASSLPWKKPTREGRIHFVGIGLFLMFGLGKVHGFVEKLFIGGRKGEKLNNHNWQVKKNNNFTIRHFQKK